MKVVQTNPVRLKKYRPHLTAIQQTENHIITNSIKNIANKLLSNEKIIVPLQPLTKYETAFSLSRAQGANHAEFALCLGEKTNDDN